MQTAAPITLSDLARQLRVPTKWLRDEAESGRIPHLKAGNQILLDADTVTKVLRDRAAREGTAARA